MEGDEEEQEEGKTSELHVRIRRSLRRCERDLSLTFIFAFIIIINFQIAYFLYLTKNTGKKKNFGYIEHLVFCSF